jgi:hypothetical protein
MMDGNSWSVEVFDAVSHEPAKTVAVSGQGSAPTISGNGDKVIGKPMKTGLVLASKHRPLHDNCERKHARVLGKRSVPIFGQIARKPAFR